MSHSGSFLSEHSPRGAGAAFSLGAAGRGGGFSIQSGLCADQDVHIGYVRDDCITVLPFSPLGQESIDTGMAAFVPTGNHGHGPARKVSVHCLNEDRLDRELRFATDTWRSQRVTFSLATPTAGGCDPDRASDDELREDYAPVIVGELTLDNRDGRSTMTGLFAVGQMRAFAYLANRTGGEMEGIECLDGYGFATAGGEDIRCFADLDLPIAFDRIQPLRARHNGMGGILIDVPPGESRTVPIALGWFRGGVATLGRRCPHLYTELFADLADVLRFGLARADAWLARARQEDQALRNSSLSADQQFLLAKSIRSYFGNTQLLRDGDGWRWVVNEGSCNMINTLDLAVDMAFYEAREHPWLLRNVLDRFADEYSYRDTVHAPDEPGKSYPGGVSFTHDHGARDAFSPPGTSHYELENHPGCFSFMTHEELLNWVLCAGLYFRTTTDRNWLTRRAELLAECLQSMQNRDHPDPARRDGLMSFDSDRCGQTDEITTYDSLDPSLGQARRNAYIGGKCWAAYLTIQWLLNEADPARWAEQADAAGQSAKLAAATLTAAFDEKLGYIPAILDGRDVSAIIPIVEPLVYPEQMGLGEALDAGRPFAEFLATLKRHLQAVLVEGRCLFPDGGWKLSAASDNSWMSKIFICQYVARKVLGMDIGGRCDAAHADWWRAGCEHHSVIDQVIAGTSPGWGSTYPRCVSCFLWLAE